jgi:hypothetical protein
MRRELSGSCRGRHWVNRLARGQVLLKVVECFVRTTKSRLRKDERLCDVEFFRRVKVKKGTVSSRNTFLEPILENGEKDASLSIHAL